MCPTDTRSAMARGYSLFDLYILLRTGPIYMYIDVYRHRIVRQHVNIIQSSQITTILIFGFNKQVQHKVHCMCGQIGSAGLQVVMEEGGRCIGRCFRFAGVFDLF